MGIAESLQGHQHKKNIPDEALPAPAHCCTAKGRRTGKVSSCSQSGQFNEDFWAHGLGVGGKTGTEGQKMRLCRCSEGPSPPACPASKRALLSALPSGTSVI